MEFVLFQHSTVSCIALSVIDPTKPVSLKRKGGRQHRSSSMNLTAICSRTFSRLSIAPLTLYSPSRVMPSSNPCFENQQGRQQTFPSMSRLRKPFALFSLSGAKFLFPFILLTVSNQSVRSKISRLIQKATTTPEDLNFSALVWSAICSVGKREGWLET